MKTLLLLNKLQGIAKSYFSFNDLQKFYAGTSDNLKVAVHRLAKQKRLFRLLKGYYTLNLTNVDWEQLACEIRRPSYISLEYALHYYNIIDQIPHCLTLITAKKGRQYNLPQQTLEYSHITHSFYFGYKIQGNMLIAEKEKALLDILYLISLKKRHLSLNNLDLTDINKQLFNQWLKKFPIYTQKLAQTILQR